MEKLKNNWLRAITGVSLVLGLILGVNAFEKKVEVKPVLDPDPVTVYFKLKSNQQSDIQQAGNWTNDPSEDCGTGDFLCEVTYDASKYASLQAFLNANPTQAMIEANALSVSHRD